MTKRLVMTLIAMTVLGFSTQAIAAGGPAGIARNVLSSSSRLVEKQATNPPFAHILFCARNPAECRDNNGESVVSLTPERLKELSALNRKVNRSIRGRNDNEFNLNGDLWEVNVKSGDCEDFALTKRSKLLSMGWSSRALRIAKAHTRSGEGHAVLIVRTDRGDLVLDNRFNNIKSFDKTDLRLEMIQSEADPLVWYNL
jgi:predicted transglutaminase-like cysteine proteinase